jgi:hypothetical protein
MAADIRYKGASFCIGMSTNDMWILPLALRNKFKVTFQLCWGPSYGTRITVGTKVSVFSITGQIVWPKSWPDGSCINCPNNRPAGYITICRDYARLIFEKKVGLQKIGLELTIHLVARVCLTIGISFSGARMDWIIGLGGGPVLKIQVRAPTAVFDAEGSGILTGTCTLTNVKLQTQWPPIDWEKTSLMSFFEGTAKAGDRLQFTYRGILAENGDFKIEDIKAYGSSVASGLSSAGSSVSSTASSAYSTASDLAQHGSLSSVAQSYHR